MSQLPAMPVWWADFFSKTDHLTNAEQWAYAKLLAKSWLRNCRWFPDEPNDIARLLNMTLERWLKIRPRLAPFFDLSGGTWRQEHLETVWGNVQERVAISQRNGKLGGRPKVNNVNHIENPAGLPTKTQSEPNQIQTQKVEESSPIGEPKKRGTRWSGVVSEEWVSEAATIRADAKLPAIDARLEAVKFADHWLGTGKTKINWHATWRNWVRNARATVNGSTRQSPGEKLYEGAFRAAERWEREHGAADFEPGGAVVIPLLDSRRSSGGP